jgi:very-short-patch-repair endonuclease
MSSSAHYPDNQAWDNHRSTTEHWSDDWVERARLHPRAARQGFVFTRAQCPISDAEIRSRVRRRIWWVPRWGVLSVIHPGADAKVAATLAATAAALTHRSSVISHQSAALLHGLPVLRHPASPILTAPRRHGERHGLNVHLTALESGERTLWYGIEVTTAARAVIDIARSCGPAAGLITADAALRAGSTSRDELATAEASAYGRPGNRAARWCLERADPLSESPLESLTRAQILLAGLPAPRLQAWIGAANARVDLLYDQQRLVIEADGMLKYQSASDLREEKRRQELLERAGYRVLRVLWDDVFGDPGDFLLRLMRALAR